MNNGVLFRTKKFIPDYRYTSNFVDSWNIDEIVVLDVTRRNQKKNKGKFIKAVRNIAHKCFVPMAVGGGIQTIEDVKNYMDAGADKIVINTGAILNPNLISEISKKYGSQAVIVSIDFKRETKSKIISILSHQGTKTTSLSLLDWAKKVEKLGAGEILLNSIDRDGSLSGYDVELSSLLSKNISIPMLIAGGAGNWKHFEEGFLKGNADAVCTSNIYHFTDKSIISAKSYLKNKNILIRN